MVMNIRSFLNSDEIMLTQKFTTVIEGWFVTVRRFAKLLVNHLARPEKGGGGNFFVPLRGESITCDGS